MYTHTVLFNPDPTLPQCIICIIDRVADPIQYSNHTSVRSPSINLEREILEIHTQNSEQFKMIEIFFFFFNQR